jgi:hypothetical protein
VTPRVPSDSDSQRRQTSVWRRSTRCVAVHNGNKCSHAQVVCSCRGSGIVRQRVARRRRFPLDLTATSGGKRSTVSTTARIPSLMAICPMHCPRLCFPLPCARRPCCLLLLPVLRFGPKKLLEPTTQGHARATPPRRTTRNTEGRSRGEARGREAAQWNTGRASGVQRRPPLRRHRDPTQRPSFFLWWRRRASSLRQRTTDMDDLRNSMPSSWVVCVRRH